MSSKNPVVGIFETARAARLVLDALRVANFSDKKVGVLTHAGDGNPGVKLIWELAGNETHPGAKTSGGRVWALGVAKGTLPSVGGVLGGGLLASVAAGAATAHPESALIATVSSLGVQNSEAEYLDSEFRRGRTIVLVDNASRCHEAEKIMRLNESLNHTLVARSP